MAELDEAELTRLQNASVAVMGAAMAGNPKHTLSPAAGAVLLAVPALTDEVRHYRAENARLHEALAFAASAIKSGESWTPTCEEMIGGALRGDVASGRSPNLREVRPGLYERVDD